MPEEMPVHTDQCCKPRRGTQAAGMSCGAYFLGFVGAAIYYIQHAVGFWDGVWGVLKAAVWPAFVVYKVMEFLKL